ncbi:MAG: ribonuclease HI family protein [bacterium]
MGIKTINFEELEIFIDGASRGNPGEAAGAAVIFDQSGAVIGEAGKYLGKATNNVAEYNALIVGLNEAAVLGGKVLKIFSDSELLVKQWNGIYRIKKPELQRLSIQARNLAVKFEKVSLRHVYREDNKEADKLANQVLNKKKSINL